MPDRLVVDASAVVDLLLGNDVGRQVELRLRGHELHAPAHVDAEVLLSTLGGLHRAGVLDDDQVSERVEMLAAAALERHSLPALLAGAWALRHTVRLVDSFYAARADKLGVTLVTTDARLAATVPSAELVGVAGGS